MRAFIILSFIGAACAGQLGNNYQPGSYSNRGLSYTTDAGADVPYSAPTNRYLTPAKSGPSYTSSSYSTPSYTSSTYSTPSYSSSSFSTSSYTAPSTSAPIYSAPSYSASSYSGPAYIAPSYSEPSNSPPSYASPSYSAPSYSAPSYFTASNSAPSYSAPSYTDPSYSAQGEVQKEFYTFSAPESEFEDTDTIQRVLGRVKQGLRVIFIKSPENKGFEDAALSLAKQAAQQQTAIYVLNKQPDITDLVDKFNAVSKNVNSKPDVHFVKYHSPEDAVNAQRIIQNQYDTLGGNSQTINGGVAPVINFASKTRTASVQQPQNAYLAPSVFRYRL